MPSDRRLSVCLSVMSCLSTPVCSLYVTLLYCGQTVGWIKMELAMQVDLGPGRIVLWGPSNPSRKGAQPPVSAQIRCGHGWMD